MTKILTKQDLIAAGVSATIFPLFDRLWPNGMEITVVNAKKAAATGLDIYVLAKQIMPTEAWTAYEAAAGLLINEHLLEFNARLQERDAAIAVNRLGITDALTEAATALNADVLLLGQDVTVLTSWDANPEVITQPFKDALEAVDMAVRANRTVHTQILTTYGTEVAAADATFETAKVTALVEIINAIPDPV